MTLTSASVPLEPAGGERCCEGVWGARVMKAKGRESWPPALGQGLQGPEWRGHLSCKETESSTVPSGSAAPLPASVLCQSHHVPENAEGRGHPGSAACSSQTWPPLGPASGRRVSQPRPLPACCPHRAHPLLQRLPLPSEPFSLCPSREGPCHSAGAGYSSAGAEDRFTPTVLAGEAHCRACRSV